ncbi:hypothetical protein Enr10x_13270 [Gimesia panareensis]|uniref:Uncharacterized protein n=1 Tax=Gimesia panareensis TaxID=2527978 RepID=A0A517Q344_9PLAN|nr:hypothetical protein Enr10x_13270 [Gimesia panareensis]
MGNGNALPEEPGSALYRQSITKYSKTSQGYESVFFKTASKSLCRELLFSIQAVEVFKSPEEHLSVGDNNRGVARIAEADFFVRFELG